MSMYRARRFEANHLRHNEVRFNMRHEKHHYNLSFQDLPKPTRPAPYHLELAEIVPTDKMNSIKSSQKLVFHAAGDTGGVKRPEDQLLVVSHMEEDFNASLDDQPAFFYNLGDVVYYYGEQTEYYQQFYEPNALYPAPIIAIPGNHDGAVPPWLATPSLEAFVNNFCTSTSGLAAASFDEPRDTMTQPNVYWTLDTPYATIIGLYTNVPEGGELDNTQLAWFYSEMESAPTNKHLIVAMHHPIYSADIHHSGSQYMEEVLEEAMHVTKRVPNLVLAGHVHNYQRFTRQRNGNRITYIVAGAGGYWHLHSLHHDLQDRTFPDTIPGKPDVRLENFCDDRHGYLKLTVTPTGIAGEYYTVPRSQESWKAPAQLLETFNV